MSDTNETFKKIENAIDTISKNNINYKIWKEYYDLLIDVSKEQDIPSNINEFATVLLNVSLLEPLSIDETQKYEEEISELKSIMKYAELYTKKNSIDANKAVALSINVNILVKLNINNYKEKENPFIGNNGHDYYSYDSLVAANKKYDEQYIKTFTDLTSEILKDIPEKTDNKKTTSYTDTELNKQIREIFDNFNDELSLQIENAIDTIKKNKLSYEKFKEFYKLLLQSAKLNNTPNDRNVLLDVLISSEVISNDPFEHSDIESIRSELSDIKRLSDIYVSTMRTNTNNATKLAINTRKSVISRSINNKNIVRKNPYIGIDGKDYYSYPELIAANDRYNKNNLSFITSNDKIKEYDDNIRKTK